MGLLRQLSSADIKEREKQATDQGFAMLLLSPKATMNLNHNNNHLHYPYTRLIQRFLKGVAATSLRKRLENPLWLGFELLRSLAVAGERESAVVRF